MLAISLAKVSLEAVMGVRPRFAYRISQPPNNTGRMKAEAGSPLAEGEHGQGVLLGREGQRLLAEVPGVVQKCPTCGCQDMRWLEAAEDREGGASVASAVLVGGVGGPLLS